MAGCQDDIPRGRSESILVCVYVYNNVWINCYTHDVFTGKDMFQHKHCLSFMVQCRYILFGLTG